jgi:hypothetical protein
MENKTVELTEKNVEQKQAKLVSEVGNVGKGKK